MRVTFICAGRFLCCCVAFLFVNSAFAQQEGMPPPPGSDDDGSEAEIAVEDVVGVTVPASLDRRRPSLGSERKAGVKSGGVLSVKDGLPQLVEVGVNHPNRFIVPFVEPDVYHSSTADIEITGSTVWVVPRDVTPITLFIKEAAEPEGRAITLALRPLAIPPKSLRLTFDDEGAPSRRGKAAPLPRNAPLVDIVRETMVSLAKGGIPGGFDDFEIFGSEFSSLCQPPAGWEVAFDGGERFVGSDFDILVGVVHRSGPSAEFEESWCAGEGVLAVSVFPTQVFQPNSLSEIFVIKRDNDIVGRPKRRRSLTEASFR